MRKIGANDANFGTSSGASRTELMLWYCLGNRDLPGRLFIT